MDHRIRASAIPSCPGLKDQELSSRGLREPLSIFSWYNFPKYFQKEKSVSAKEKKSSKEIGTPENGNDFISMKIRPFLCMSESTVVSGSRNYSGVLCKEDHRSRVREQESGRGAGDHQGGEGGGKGQALRVPHRQQEVYAGGGEAQEGEYSPQRMPLFLATVVEIGEDYVLLRQHGNNQEFITTAPPELASKLQPNARVAINNSLTIVGFWTAQWT